MVNILALAADDTLDNRSVLWATASSASRCISSASAMIELKGSSDGLLEGDMLLFRFFGPSHRTIQATKSNDYRIIMASKTRRKT
ncbi:MAG: hypothetical protein FJZ79_10370 [Chlorobi bacterium]|nr:hypothetical protein [Chlorobiota bacterium]